MTFQTVHNSTNSIGVSTYVFHFAAACLSPSKQDIQESLICPHVQNTLPPSDPRWGLDLENAFVNSHVTNREPSGDRAMRRG